MTHDADKPNTPDPGIFITRGVRVIIPAGGLRIRVTEEGEMVADPLVIHLGLDMCPYWLELAVGHVFNAQAANSELRSAVAEADAEKLGAALEKEFLAGMQAMVAAAVGVDALYAAIKERSLLPEELRRTWAKKRPARERQIYEVFRRAVKIAPRNLKVVRSSVAELMKFRGLAVHPPAEAKEAANHPDLNRPSEWRFVAFGYPNAREATRMAVALVSYVSQREPKATPELPQYLKDLHSRVEPIKQRFEEAFGPVFRRDDKTSDTGTKGEANSG